MSSFENPRILYGICKILICLFVVYVQVAMRSQIRGFILLQHEIMRAATGLCGHLYLHFKFLRNINLGSNDEVDVLQLVPTVCTA